MDIITIAIIFGFGLAVGWIARKMQVTKYKKTKRK